MIRTQGVKPAHQLIEQDDLILTGLHRWEIVRRVIPLHSGMVRISTPLRVLFFQQDAPVEWMDRRHAAGLLIAQSALRTKAR